MRVVGPAPSELSRLGALLFHHFVGLRIGAPHHFRRLGHDVFRYDLDIRHRTLGIGLGGNVQEFTERIGNPHIGTALVGLEGSEIDIVAVAELEHRCEGNMTTVRGVDLQHPVIGQNVVARDLRDLAFGFPAIGNEHCEGRRIVSRYIAQGKVAHDNRGCRGRVCRDRRGLRKQSGKLRIACRGLPFGKSGPPDQRVALDRAGGDQCLDLRQGHRPALCSVLGVIILLCLTV